MKIEKQTKNSLGSIDLSQASQAPDKTGVYMFLDNKNKPIYIGRALSLKKRLSQYFLKNIDPRIAEMVGLAKKIKYIETANILESIISEANLIKKHWPKYNVKDKDNRSFVYLVIAKTDYPRPFIVRGRELEKFSKAGYVFGPYQSWTLLKNALKIIRRVFPYSICKPLSGKPCFDYQVGLCPGTCLGKISKKDYQKNIRNMRLFLSGQKKRLLNRLAKENPDKAKFLKHIQDVSLISDDNLALSKINRIEGYDISHLTGKETYGAMVVFSNGKPDKSQYRLFKIKESNDDLRSLAEMISRRLNHLEWPLPGLMLIDGGKPQIDFLTKVLADRNVDIPLIGISKFSNDKLVFAPKTKKSLKELAGNIRSILLRARDEAHRFSLKASRAKRRLTK